MKEYMDKTINIGLNGIAIKAELNNTWTAKKILEALPLSGNTSIWGSEIYFTIPIDSVLENGIEIVELGTLAYWPPGKAFCIFFGPTPANTGPEPRAAGTVTVVGKIKDLNDIKLLEKVNNGAIAKLKLVK